MAHPHTSGLHAHQRWITSKGPGEWYNDKSAGTMKHSWRYVSAHEDGTKLELWYDDVHREDRAAMAGQWSGSATLVVWGCTNLQATAQITGHREGYMRVSSLQPPGGHVQSFLSVPDQVPEGM